MVRTERICAECGGSIQIEDQFCPACGLDTQAELMPTPTSSLAQKAVAAAPALLAVGLVVLKLGGSLLRNSLVRQLLAGGHRGLPDVRRDAASPTSGGRLHVRRRWRIHHRDGRHTSGEEEETYTFT
ncbi:MAG: hypothetical protein F4Y80_05385 [Caldilineaceae bacterium SB0665_bin_21]|nr:hypothetical protein [Caldilineaceae bacterium SB0665_bin_21]MYA03700.1 hypothetical protein [Caldilineaceae bacterium SB0664_bin_22]MYC62770.1 hypothetical protein [Caldilineaceae bacterium SB0661_bin_34]